MFALALGTSVSYAVVMDDMATLSKEQLLELLADREQKLSVQANDLQTKDDQLRQLDIELQTVKSTNACLQSENEELALAYNRLLQRRFRNSSERYISNPDQLRLDFGDTDEAANAAEGLADAVEEQKQTIPEHKRRVRKKRDESLPAHFPRQETIADVPSDVKECSIHGERKLLPKEMWDRQETLKYKPPTFYVQVTLFPKYACADAPECGIASPERPIGIVEGNKYGSCVAAQIITNKHGYHLPVYRQQDYFAGSGWTPGRSTLLNILKQSHFVLEPFLSFCKRTVQTDSAVGCDDTGLTLLYPKTVPVFDLSDAKQRRIHEVFSKALAENKPSIHAKMWAYRGVQVKLNVFDFTVSRHRDGPELFFANYTGTLLGDCWHGFESIACNSNGAIVRAACNAHARRKFRESTAYPDDAKIWLDWYCQLYDIEDRGKEMPPNDRLALRQAEAKPIFEQMEAWLAEVKLRTKNVILPKSDFAKALQYVRNHFAELQRYLEDGTLPIDNNDTEQLMKQVAISRKNWLFAGSVAGGERVAGFMTLVSSAIRNDLDVWAYTHDVLEQLLSGVTEYEPLLPWNWRKTHPDAIRQYRIEERTQRTDAKRAKRQARRSHTN